jgi:NADH:ubiquinone oxidoreductase subunit 2 (subunit N)
VFLIANRYVRLAVDPFSLWTSLVFQGAHDRTIINR